MANRTPRAGRGIGETVSMPMRGAPQVLAGLPG